MLWVLCSGYYESLSDGGACIECTWIAQGEHRHLWHQGTLPGMASLVHARAAQIVCHNWRNHPTGEWGWAYQQPRWFSVVGLHLVSLHKAMEGWVEVLSLAWLALSHSDHRKWLGLVLSPNSTYPKFFYFISYLSVPTLFLPSQHHPSCTALRNIN